MISLKCDDLLFVSAHHLSALIKLSAIVFAEDIFFLTKFGRGLKSNTKDVLFDIADGVKSAKVLQQRPLAKFYWSNGI